MLTESCDSILQRNSALAAEIEPIAETLTSHFLIDNLCTGYISCNFIHHPDSCGV